VGLGPRGLRAAYGLPADGPLGRTIAVVVAFDAPHVEAELVAYRARFDQPRLRPGQFRKLDQSGGKHLPPADPSWALEAAIDTQMASAICSTCDIVLMEANSDWLADLATAVRTAAQLPGVVSVSNSYGLPESAEAMQYEPSYRSSSAWITVASGDSGFGVMAPAAFTGVVAVGGTSLKVNADGTRASETAWSGGGSGCSRYAIKPSWQPDQRCTQRTVTDVAAVADPLTGVAVIVNDGNRQPLTWVVAGGTSVSAPIIAGIHALSGSPGDWRGSLYERTAASFDITQGMNGDCAVRYWCTARMGYDGPTGVGAPDGTFGF
jgi:subtilase family serine protease